MSWQQGQKAKDWEEKKLTSKKKYSIYMYQADLLTEGCKFMKVIFAKKKLPSLNDN